MRGLLDVARVALQCRLTGESISQVRVHACMHGVHAAIEGPPSLESCSVLGSSVLAQHICRMTLLPVHSPACTQDSSRAPV